MNGDSSVLKVGVFICGNLSVGRTHFQIGSYLEE